MARSDSDPIVEAAKDQARVRLNAAEAAADAARELASVSALPMAALNRPTEDVLGNALPDDDAEARIQQREAIAIRATRVDVDVARVQRGLPPLYADK